eukprot:16385-Heterococcus_DN1.PRE.2
MRCDQQLSSDTAASFFRACRSAYAAVAVAAEVVAATAAAVATCCSSCCDCLTAAFALYCGSRAAVVLAKGVPPCPDTLRPRFTTVQSIKVSTYCSSIGLILSALHAAAWLVQLSSSFVFCCNLLACSNNNMAPLSAIALVASACAVSGFMAVPAARSTSHMAMQADAMAPFRAGKALKIISGITNFNQELVVKVAQAAEAGGATHLDIAADAVLVKAAKAAAPNAAVLHCLTVLPQYAISLSYAMLTSILDSSSLTLISLTTAFALYCSHTVSICVSAIDPDELVPCVAAGADMVELGNFDMFYDQGLTFTAADVLDMTIRT